MLQELVTSCFLIVAAEMGDKSQILAMTFATRYTIRQVMLGVFFGILLNHGIAVALGTSLSLIISLDIVRALAGVVFVIFALLTLAKMDEDELESTNNHRYGPVVTVSMAVFISELGDKTQLATITLASSSQYPLFVLAGTVSGMVITSAIGIFVGSRMGKRVPEFAMKVVSALVFLFFGLASLYQNLPQAWLTPDNMLLAGIGLGIAVALLIWRGWNIHKSQTLTPYKARAERLRQHLVGIKALIDDLCLDQEPCPNCECDRCMLEQAKENINAYLNKKAVVPISDRLGQLQIDRRRFDLGKAREAFCLTVVACQNCRPQHRETCVLNETRKALEKICFDKVLPFTGDMNAYLAEVETESPVLAGKIRRMLTSRS
ncbi:MAG TPA: TMEM165/GDT1 family protein [Firmicutes bacterium]|nr:TMEM165/GDT1 family protein [Bacillota bacterium]